MKIAIAIIGSLALLALLASLFCAFDNEFGWAVIGWIVGFLSTIAIFVLALVK